MFLAIEIVAFACFFFALRDALQRGADKVMVLAASSLFGLIIEVFFVHFYSGYSYGNFYLDPPVLGESVPLWVAVGWGTIIYVSREAAARTGMPWAAQAGWAALLALLIDLGLDPVAEAAGWWHWSRAGDYFGVPYDNFIGWLMIVGLYNLWLSALWEKWKPGLMVSDTLPPLIAIPLAAMSVAAGQVILEKVYPLIGEPATFLLLVGLCCQPWWLMPSPPVPLRHSLCG
jgi:uncharacterized membrane protein